MSRHPPTARPRRWFLCVPLALLALACADDTDATDCGNLTAHRIVEGQCPVTEDTGIRWCKPDSQDHWGIGVHCMTDPDGDIFIVEQPFGTSLVDAEGWAFVSPDAGAQGATCRSALQTHTSCAL